MTEILNNSASREPKISLMHPIPIDLCTYMVSSDKHNKRKACSASKTGMFIVYTISATQLLAT